MNEMLVTFHVRRIWIAKAWVRACSLLSYVVGEARASRWATDGASKIVKLEMGK